MFWQTENHIDDSSERAAPGAMRRELVERLRLMAEFATLGAYEPAEPAAHGEAPHARDGEPTQRVFVFARAPEAACAGGRAAAPACPATASARIPRPTRGSLRHRLPRRRAGVEAAQQPCTWARTAPAAPSRRDR